MVRIKTRLPDTGPHPNFQSMVNKAYFIVLFVFPVSCFRFGGFGTAKIKRLEVQKALDGRFAKLSVMRSPQRKMLYASSDAGKISEDPSAFEAAENSEQSIPFNQQTGQSNWTRCEKDLDVILIGNPMVGNPFSL